MSHCIRHLDLFVTEACNLACPYCFARDRSDAARMTLERARKAIHWLAGSRHSHVHVTFWGGEPLLRLPWLKQVAQELQDRMRDAGKTVSMSLPTNATLLAPDALDWIERFKVKVFLSIDGDERTQAQRPLASGKNSHELATAGLQAMLHRFGTVTVRMTVTPANVEDLPENIAYFARQGVRRLMVYPAYDQDWSVQDIEAWGEAEKQVAHRLASWIVRMSPRLPIRLDAWMGPLRWMAGLRESRRPTDPISPCGVGESLVALHADGRYSPCHRFTFYGRSKGEPWDLGDDDRGILACDDFRTLTLERQRGQVRCVHCESFAACTMGCVAINYAPTGSLYQVPAWACALQKKRIQACQFLHESLDGHPAYAAYLGQTATALLQTRAQEMGNRAAKLWATLS
ncbi:MAG TPA: radical SAM protein [Polyangiaceae bacterium]|nr:radical SAM protein [Polyangiaceae bacterium]